MKRIPRVLRWILGALIAFEILYVLAAILVVQTGQVDKWVNKNPDKLLVTFDSAWTFVPGLVHIGGARVVNQGRGNQLEAVVDRARVFVNPFALIGKTVSAWSFTANGVEFRFRNRPKTAEEKAEKAEIVPPIEGVPYEAYSGPPKQPKPDKKGWVIDVKDAHISDIREVWIGPLRLRGQGAVEASVRVETGAGTGLSIRRADVRFEDTELALKNLPLTTTLALHVDGKMEPFNTRETRGKAILGLVSAKVDLSGTGTAQVLNSYFGKAEWLRFEGEPRTVTAKLEIEKGLFLPGGFIDLERGLLTS